MPERTPGAASNLGGSQTTLLRIDHIGQTIMRDSMSFPAMLAPADLL
jgi:hypothetical protein